MALTLVACDGKDDTAGDDESDADTDADTDADADADSDTDNRMTVKGTFDGEPFDLDCPPDTLGTTRTSKGQDTVVAVCAATDSYSVTVWAIEPMEGLVECGSAGWVLVAPAIGDSYTCLGAGGTTSFEMDLTVVTDVGDASVWEGTFAMAGGDTTHVVDVSGSFHLRFEDL